MRKRILLLPLLFLAACAQTVTTVPPRVLCATSAATISDDFPGARRGACDTLSDTRFRVHIEPEDEQVRNPSPWFAFRVDRLNGRALRIHVDYGSWEHRYVPKISDDGEHWRVMDPDLYELSGDERVLTIRLPAGDGAVFIAAQELLMPADYERWSRQLATREYVTRSVPGRSRQDRPIWLLESGAGNHEVVLLTGRQHPPEVSGSIAQLAFLDTVFGDSPLAVRFRERFRVLAIPLMNPDGVVDGHWRHNLGATDLNRDWGPFVQPETRLIRRLLQDIEAEGGRPVAFVDFHSTRDNKFYTQAEVTQPANFSATWLERAGRRLPDYVFENAPRPRSATSNGKNYMYKRYGIPSLTYEVADEEDRKRVRDAARVFAEEFMRLWLERDVPAESVE